MQQQLEKLVQTPGISGNEKLISQCLKGFYEPYCDEIIYDNLGSIYAVKHSQTKNALRVLINAHMDELGFIVKKINDNATIQALALGTFLPNALLGKKVKLTTSTNETFYGVLLGQDQKQTALNNNNEVLLDFGFSTKKEALDHVCLGDMVTLAGEMFMSNNEQFMYATNWNGRLSVSHTIDILRSVADESFDFDLYVGCTVQEHVGIRGAQTATNLVKPDLTIVIDTQQAFDYQSENKDQQGVLGNGLLLTYYDTTVLPNRLLLNTLKEVCEQEKIAYQYYYSLTGSDAGWINKLRTGCPTLLMGQALRNLDTGFQVASVNDYQALKAGLVSFVKQLTPSLIQAFKQENR